MIVADKQKLPVRKQIRMAGYDYSTNGLYFVTICTKNKACVLSKIIEQKDIVSEYNVELSDIGKKVVECMRFIEDTQPYLVEFVDYVVMPNHLHLIVAVRENHKITLQNILYKLKSYTTHQYGQPLWQRSYFDHVIRNEKDYLATVKYINNNPAKWLEDKYYLSK